VTLGRSLGAGVKLTPSSNVNVPFVAPEGSSVKLSKRRGARRQRAN
jgi:hypothetical protein